MKNSAWTRQKRTIYIVLPAFNEEQCINTLLRHIDSSMLDAGLCYQVLLIDDGSVDRTYEIANECAQYMPVRIIRHPVNKGLGTTIKDGLFEAARMSTDSDVVITMDADDTHTPGLILRMVRMISEGHDVVIASRFQREARTIGVPLYRRILSTTGSILLRILFPITGVRDYTCGYRAYRAAVLKQAIARYGAEFIDQDGFQCMVDILLKLRSMRLVFGEVPFVLRYDFKEGGSKMDVRRTICKTLSLIVKRRIEL